MKKKTKRVMGNRTRNCIQYIHSPDWDKIHLGWGSNHCSGRETYFSCHIRTLDVPVFHMNLPLILKLTFLDQNLR